MTTAASTTTNRTAADLGPALRYEWVRLTTSRAARVLFIVMVVFAVLAMASLAADIRGRGLSTDVVVANLTLAGDLTGIPIVASLAGLMAVLAITDDLGTPQGATTFLVVPVRARATSAKLLTVGAVGFAASLVTSLGALAVSAGSTAADGAVSWTAVAVGHALACFLWTMWGLGLGMLTRSAAGAVALLFGLPLVGEVLFGLVLVANEPPEWAGSLLPFRSMVMVMSDERPWLSGAVAAGVSALVYAAGWARLRASDI